MAVRLCGILNLTPDSFSDGGIYSSEEKAFEAALQMIDAGASIIDIGGDSTRPNSVCVDLEEEWKRISNSIKFLVKKIDVSVDTHKAEIARRAINEGAKIINDISAGSDPNMFEVVANSKSSLVIMFSSCKAPHNYADNRYLGIDDALKFLRQKSTLAVSIGIPKERVVIDPGMGRFISEDPEDSFEILRDLNCFENITGRIMLGVSRKGFLKDRSDQKSAAVAYQAIENLNVSTEVILRVHNVKAHQKVGKS